MKKKLKVWLIIGGSMLVLGGSWAWLTNIGIVPNWCNIKCMIGCGCINCPIIMGWSCSNNCEKKCDVPKYEKCISKCKKPDIEGYNEKNYDIWHAGNGRVSRMTAYYGDYDVALSKNIGYEQWINENFSGHQEELKEYELCLSTCGEAPYYRLYN